jgi:hypothetical protein
MKHVESDNTAAVKHLYMLGGGAAVLMVMLIVAQLIVFIAAPPPLEGTVQDWFNLFQKNQLIGLLNFELLMILYTLISIPLYVALYFALKQTHLPMMILFLAFSVIGVTAFLAARPAFEMLHLSNQYALATTEAQRLMYLVAGEMLIATFHGTAFQVGYVLGSISGLLLAYVMLKSNVFNRTTAYIRIASALFDFGIFIPGIGTVLSIFAVLFLLVWDILVAIRLFKLGRVEVKKLQPALKAA